jgi:hypothetical protein
MASKKVKVLTDAEMQKGTAEFKETLTGKTLDELKAIEQDLIKEFDDLNDRRKATEFDLPEEGWETAATTICNFLDKKEAAWNVGFALIGIYEFWKKESYPKTIPFSVFEVTIQTLGELTYKGYDEWTAIAGVNKYFEPIHPAYAEIVMGMRYLGMKHSAVQDAMGLNTPIGA